MTNSLTFFDVTGHYSAVADPSISGVLNSPVVQPVSGLCTFTPRVPKGQLFYVSDYLITEAYNALQQVNLLGVPTGGTWTLSYGGYITPPLAWDITPEEVQAALEALASIGAGNVTVVADVEPQAFDVEFTGTLGLQEMQPLVGDADLLTNDEGAGFCEITVTMTALGSPQITADTAISLPPLTARIWNGVLSTIDRVDTPGFQLTANSAVLNLDDDLIYDVTFSSVTFNGASQYLAPFAFVAPVGDTAMCITDPGMNFLPYDTPNQTIWTPPGQSSEVFGNVNTKYHGRAPHGAPAAMRARRNWRTA